MVLYLIQAVVDSNYLFCDINVGWPGSVHDAHVFLNSALYEKVTSGNFLQGHVRYIEGKNVPLFLVGDSGYPFLKWLLKPFPFSGDLPAARKNI